MIERNIFFIQFVMRRMRWSSVVCSGKNKVQAEHICRLNAVGIMNHISEHLEPVQAISAAVGDVMKSERRITGPDSGFAMMSVAVALLIVMMMATIASGYMSD